MRDVKRVAVRVRVLALLRSHVDNVAGEVKLTTTKESSPSPHHVRVVVEEATLLKRRVVLVGAQVLRNAIAKSRSVFPRESPTANVFVSLVRAHLVAMEVRVAICLSSVMSVRVRSLVVTATT